MLPQHISCRQRHNIILFNEPRRKRALPRARFAKHEHPHELALRAVPILRSDTLACIPERERDRLLRCRGPPERPLQHARHVPASALAKRGGEQRAGAGEENGHAEGEGGESEEEAGSLRNPGHGLYTVSRTLPQCITTQCSPKVCDRSTARHRRAVRGVSRTPFRRPGTHRQNKNKKSEKLGGNGLHTACARWGERGGRGRRAEGSDGHRKYGAA